MADEADIIETNLFDWEEIHPDCTAQILTNRVTGEPSVGSPENKSGRAGCAGGCVRNYAEPWTHCDSCLFGRKNEKD